MNGCPKDIPETSSIKHLNSVPFGYLVDVPKRLHKVKKTFLMTGCPMDIPETYGATRELNLDLFSHFVVIPTRIGLLVFEGFMISWLLS
jgi:hypothetical protein